MQHLLGRAVWDEDAVRDDVRGYVAEHVGDPGAVLVIDETGDLKKGTATVGVKRQYTGTAGRVDNAEVAVYLVFATDAGHAVVDRELYLPRSWTDDPERCRAAGMPDQVGFATKPELATAMICRALDAGVPAAWVAGDDVYGANPGSGQAGGPRGRLGAGGRLRPPGGLRWHHPACRRPAPVCPGAGVAVALVRQGRQGPPPVPVGVPAPGPWRGCFWRPGGQALAAGPPQPHDRRAGLLPLLYSPPHPAGRPGQGRRAALDH
jgi:DDE superfamily endonuclease